jgi:hypothetical protein
MIGYVTDSTLIGTVVGGDPLGAMIGDALNDNDTFGNGGEFGGSGASASYDINENFS